jgi:hypothetical protein
MRRYLAYLKALLRHKWFVYLEGRKLGLGIVRLLIHDWDKFMPDEWFAYARTFYSPDGTKQYVEGVDFARAWMKHQHRNKHHWQYWLNAGETPLPYTNILVWDRGTASIVIGDGVYDWHWQGEITVRGPMPDLDRAEMLADWRGAGRAYATAEKPYTPDSTREWYENGKHTRKLHPETQAWIEAQLGVTA